MGTKTSMRELFVISGESTHTSLVLSTASEGDTSDCGEEFFLVLDDAARDTLRQCLDPQHQVTSDLNTDSDITAREDGESDADDHAHPQVETEDIVEATMQQQDLLHCAQIAPDINETSAEESSPTEEASEESLDVRPEREIDPAFTRPLSMRPREIQDRIRGGASVKELAEIMNVAESRVEPYAYPVLAEREGMAETAKHAYPIIDDKPSSETLYEVLAQAFASRNSKLSSAQWDSYRDESKQWIVRLSWNQGLSLITAQWRIHREKNGQSTVEPANAEAADLIDPNFVRPVRRLATITSLQPIINRSADALDNPDTPLDSQHTEDPQRPENLRPTDSDEENSPAQISLSETSQSASALTDVPAKNGVAQEQGTEKETEDSFLLNPDPTTPQSAPRRRKKSTAPRWEDVLLGIRTTTKHSRK